MKRPEGITVLCAFGAGNVGWLLSALIFDGSRYLAAMHYLVAVGCFAFALHAYDHPINRR